MWMRWFFVLSSLDSEREKSTQHAPKSPQIVSIYFRFEKIVFRSHKNNWIVFGCSTKSRESSLRSGQEKRDYFFLGFCSIFSLTEKNSVFFGIWLPQHEWLMIVLNVASLSLLSSLPFGWFLVVRKFVSAFLMVRIKPSKNQTETK